MFGIFQSSQTRNHSYSKWHFPLQKKKVFFLSILTTEFDVIDPSFPAVMFPSSIQTHPALPESVISAHEMARLECPTVATNDQQTIEFGYGGQPQAVLPQGGQGNHKIWTKRNQQKVERPEIGL